jgi:hypothetical protein
MWWLFAEILIGLIAILIMVVLFIRGLWQLAHNLAHPKPDKPVIKLEEYEALLHEACDIEHIKWKGLWWRLLKLYWKRLFFILFMLMVPGIGWIILFICAVFWAVNTEKENTAMMREYFERQAREREIRRNKPSARAARAISKGIRKGSWFVIKNTVKYTWKGLWGARRAWIDLKEGR